MDLSNKVVIITGASRGIGKSIAIKLSKKKIKLALLARTKKDLKKVVDQLSNSTEVFYQVVDITKENEVVDFVHNVVNRYKKIDAIVNNAGYVKPLSLLETSLQDWKNQIDINLTGTFIMTKEVVKYMKGYGGKIINIASTAGLTPRPGWCAYAAGKAGVINFSLTMSEELKQYNIKVYCIAPGRTATELRKILAPEEDQSKILQPEGVADLVYTLLKEEGDFIDGQVIKIAKATK